jgi:hypothetical protein
VRCRLGRLIAGQAISRAGIHAGMTGICRARQTDHGQGGGSKPLVCVGCLGREATNRETNRVRLTAMANGVANEPNCSG